MAYGPTSPPRFPKELIKAIPEAAAYPVRNSLGKEKKDRQCYRCPPPQAITGAWTQQARSSCLAGATQFLPPTLQSPRDSAAPVADRNYEKPEPSLPHQRVVEALSGSQPPC